MVLDYSEKRGPRESAERKPIQKNRPRKEPVALFALLSVAALVLAFGAGVLLGWFLFRGPRKPLPMAVVAQETKQPEKAPTPARPKIVEPDAPLTFYMTLPAGGKGTIGTGLNLKKAEPALRAPRPVPLSPLPAPADAPPKPAAAVNAGEKQKAAPRFLVQIASYRDRQEADTAQAKFVGTGVAAYIVESKLPDKGVWFRIRVGRHLSRAKAEELAKNVPGAIVLTE